MNAAVTALPPDDVTVSAERLLEIVARYESLAVAFSGGVDSAVVAKAARLACGDRSAALTGVSPSVAASDLADARRVAAEIGIHHAELPTEEFAREAYRANRGDRCYHCKDTLYATLRPEADRLGLAALANGTNTDDLGDYRPGLRAAEEAGVFSPLVEAGLGKHAVREVAREWGLPVWSKPASPCLSSRIAVGVKATPERTARVEAAESLLRELLGTAALRVRVEAGELARIEVPVDLIGRVADAREHVARELRSLGFRAVTVDLEGFRSGSLNTLVPLEMRPR